MRANPFLPKVRKGLLKRMEQDGCRTFSDKVRWVEDHIPSISDPASFVGELVAESRKNPVRVKGGEESWRFAKAVADAYARAPMFDKAALPSYRALAASIEKIFKQILSKVEVRFVPGQPYVDDREMAEKVKATGILYISTDYNSHPFFNPEQNLKFRAVHDWFSHIVTGAEFSQRGELKAYNAQAKVTSREALPALFTEVIGQAAYATTYGDFPPQKVAILPGFDYYNVGEGPAAPPLQRNPHDPEYTVEMGEGAFSQVFAKPDLLSKFYTSPETGEAVDRGERAVETITRKQVGATEDGWGDSEGVDVSKMILCMARAKLRKDKDALAYLPTIHPVRIDYTDPDAPELVFTMPTYRAFADIPAGRVPDVPAKIATSLSRKVTGEDSMHDAAARFDHDVKANRWPEALQELPHVKKVLETLHEVSAELPLSKVRADMHLGNLALDKDGHLIILDPMVAEMKFTQAEKLWKQLGWPGAK